MTVTVLVVVVVTETVATSTSITAWVTVTVVSISKGVTVEAPQFRSAPSVQNTYEPGGSRTAKVVRLASPVE